MAFDALTLIFVLVVFIVLGVAFVNKINDDAAAEQKKIAGMSSAERVAYVAHLKEREKIAKQAMKDSFIDPALGPESPNLICPHCQTKGKVRTKQIKQKVGVSGGKATGAVLTGGLSLFATGLSRKQEVTEASLDFSRLI